MFGREDDERGQDESEDDTECDLGSDEESIDPLSTNSDTDCETRDDSDQSGDQATFPRLCPPPDETFTDDLAREGHGEGSRLSCGEEGDREEVGESC